MPSSNNVRKVTSENYPTDVVCIAVLFQRGLHDLAHQLPVVQVLVLQLAGVNVGVLVHVLAVVDDLVEVTFVFVREGVLRIVESALKFISGMKCSIIKCFGRIISVSAQSSVAVEIDDSGIVFAQMGRAILVVFCALRWAGSIFMCRIVVMTGADI